jgi:hypothetical protein
MEKGEKWGIFGGIFREILGGEKVWIFGGFFVIL